ncbi:MAG: AAA family ATPase, partial [Caulobacter sp.]
MSVRVLPGIVGGAACIAMVGGVALTAASTGIAAGAVVASGNLLLNLALGSVGELVKSFAGAAISDQGLSGLKAWLARADTGKLPINHDLARAIRHAQLDGLEHLVSTFDGAVEHRRFRRRACDWLKAARREADRPDFMAGPVSAEDISLTNGVLDQLSTNAVDPARFGRALDDTMLGEFAFHGSRWGWLTPPEFEAAFRGEVAGQIGWRSATESFFAHRLKRDDAVALRTAFEFEQLRGINSKSDAFADALASSNTALSARLEEISARLDGLAAAERLRGHSREVAFRKAAIAGYDVDEVLAQLKIQASAGTAWTRTALWVDERICSLADRALHGREQDFEALDDALSRNLGLVVLTGAAGSGKSSLLAQWIDQLQGVTVVRHFISVNQVDTVGPAQIEGHLAAQLRSATGANPRSHLEGSGLSQEITEAICAWDWKQGSSRLVVVLDGLDEASDLVPSFVPPTLPDGVLIVVSCRSGAADERPPMLRSWLKHIDDGRGGAVRRHIQGLDVASLEKWILAEASRVSAAEAAKLAGTLFKNLDGLPLFVSEVLPDFLKALNDLPDGVPDRQSLINGPIPTSFESYIKEQLRQLEETHGAPWTHAMRRLFSLLCVAKGDILELEALEILQKAGWEAVQIGQLDPRVARWFSFRGAMGQRSLAFHHPLLAERFSEVMGPELSAAREALLDWCQSAWRPKSVFGDPKPGSSYALDHIVAHLLYYGPQGQSLARDLLYDPEFVLARLADHQNAPRRLRQSLDEWARLPTDLKASDRARSWTGFWARKEPAVLSAWRLDRTTPSYAQVVQHALGDALIEDADGQPLPHRVLNPRRLPQSSLLRAHDVEASTAIVTSRGQVVTGGRDGRVLFWTAEGVCQTPQADPAHSGGVRGVVDRGDRGLVSWGYDGRVLFWTAEGVCQTPQAEPAHSGSVSGVVDLGDRGLVSWG